MAYNADIGEQFEVVQRWISGGNSSGGFSGQSDPFLGVPENGAAPLLSLRDRTRESVSVSARRQRRSARQSPAPRPASTGACISSRRPSPHWDVFATRCRGARNGAEPAWSVREDGEADRLTSLSLEAQSQLEKDEAIDAWKEAIEDPIEQEKFRSASIWAAIRAHGGVLRMRLWRLCR